MTTAVLLLFLFQPMFCAETNLTLNMRPAELHALGLLAVEDCPTDGAPTMKTTPMVLGSLFVLAVANATAAQTPLFPDTSKTPGVIRLVDTVNTPGKKPVIVAVTAKRVCVPGSSKAVRNVPTSEKNAVYKKYGILRRAPGSYEIDHDISLELGGSNAIGNLWPEIYDINVGGFNEGAHTKDALENKLHSLMCSGKLTMTQAQNAIRGDWRVAYKKYVSPKFPKYVAPKKKPV